MMGCLLYSRDGATFTDIPQVPSTTMGDINQLTTTSAPHPLGMRGSISVNVKANGGNVVGATVNGTWSNAHTDPGAGVTDGRGIAAISANGDCSTSTYTFTVTSARTGCSS